MFNIYKKFFSFRGYSSRFQYLSGLLITLAIYGISFLIIKYQIKLTPQTFTYQTAQGTVIKWTGILAFWVMLFVSFPLFTLTVRRLKDAKLSILIPISIVFSLFRPTIVIPIITVICLVVPTRHEDEKVSKEDETNHQETFDNHAEYHYHFYFETDEDSQKGDNAFPKSKGKECPYDILGVSPEDDLETIKQVWKNLSKTYHPDISHSRLAEEKIKKINDAWDEVQKLRASEK